MGTTEDQLDCMMKIEPQQQHAWLRRLVGDWTYEVQAPAAPGQPPQKLGGAETVRALGEIWIVAEGGGEMPDGREARTQMTLGYDPQRKRYVGTWFGSMMTHLWVYDGELDAAERVLTLYADGPTSDEQEKPGKFKDVIEIKSDNERTLTGYMLGEDGQWQELMTAHYRRQK